jgi:hypothetical protein
MRTFESLPGSKPFQQEAKAGDCCSSSAAFSSGGSQKVKTHLGKVKHAQYTGVEVKRPPH